jgi:N-acetylneuraminic acid mutarotase
MTWSAVGSLNIPRRGLAVATAPATSPQTGSRLYAVGGDGGTANPASIFQVEAYDPSANTWAVLAAALPLPRTNLAAAATAGKLHVIGGATPAASNAHNVYTPATGAWTGGAVLLTARSQLAAVTGPDGRIYAIGGLGATATAFLDTLEIYDPVADHWTTGTPMPTARAGLAACLLGGLIYAIGGENSTSNALNTVDVYNPAANTWGVTALPSLPAGRTRLAASPGPGGLMFAIGGFDNTRTAQTTVYGWDGSAAAWSAQPSLTTAQAELGAAVGPDGRLYAVGGQATLAEPTTEVLNLTTTQPDPYIGNGTYQSPDIILVDSVGNVVPLGGAPMGPWDTLLTPNTDYTIRAVIHNDSAAAAPQTVVRFWHFPGGVGTAGTLIDTQYVTVPAGGSITSTSAHPFHSAASGVHECAVVSVANVASAFFNVDPTTAVMVPDPTVSHPPDTTHFGSAWRNTDSIVVGPGGMWHLRFAATPGLPGGEKPVEISVSTGHVPREFNLEGEAARLSETLTFLGAETRAPLFLAPRVRGDFKAAPDLAITIGRSDERPPVRLPEGSSHPLQAKPGHPAPFTVSGTIPQDTRLGDAFLVDVSARYPEAPGQPERTVRFLEVIYVRDVFHKRRHDDDDADGGGER